MDWWVVGLDLYKLTLATSAGILSQAITFTGDAAKALLILVQRGNSDTMRYVLRDTTAGADRVSALVTWTGSTVATVGGALVVQRWFDDDAVQLALATDSVTASATNELRIHVAGTAGSYVYATALQAQDNQFPHRYVATSAAAVVVNHTFRMPPSGLFTVDCIVRPWFTYDIASGDPTFWTWRVSATVRLICFYEASTDTISLNWRDTGTGRALATATLTNANLHQRLRIIASLDLSNGGVTTGSRLLVIPLSTGTVLEDTSWSGVIDAFGSTFPTISQGHANSASIANSEYEHLRVYAGTLVGTVASDADATALLADMDMIFDQTDQTKFTVDAAGIAGHNLHADSIVRVEGNNWDTWSYSQSGSVASYLVRESMTWREDIMLKFMTRRQRQYWRFTIEDTNNDEGYLEIGRLFLGEYLQITPSSFIEFPLTIDTTDQVSYSMGRQLYGDRGVRYTRLAYQFPATDDDQKKLVEAMWINRGLTGPIWFMNYDTDYDRIPPIYMHIATPITFRSEGDRWKWELDLVEVK